MKHLTPLHSCSTTASVTPLFHARLSFVRRSSPGKPCAASTKSTGAHFWYVNQGHDFLISIYNQPIHSSRVLRFVGEKKRSALESLLKPSPP